MIRGDRPQFCSQLRRTVVSQLIGVEPHAETVLARGAQYSTGFPDREGLRIDERIGVFGELLAGNGGKDLVDQKIDVVRPSIPVLGRHRVRTEKRIDDLYRMLSPGRRKS